jgi:hypothetical protein
LNVPGAHFDRRHHPQLCKFAASCAGQCAWVAAMVSLFGYLSIM